MAAPPRPPSSSASASGGRRPLVLPIPVTIITGALGSGKTTALCSLVGAARPPHELWCVIVNEFGAVGIDAAAIEASGGGGGVVVRQIAGGCMCCALSGPLSAAVAQIIRHVRPDRVLIEPSGLGHPAGLLDVLQGPHLRSSLQLRAIICLVDLSTFSDPAALLADDTAGGQLTVADVLVGSKADAAPPGAAEAFQAWAAQQFPPKEEVLVMAHGQLDPRCLSLTRSAGQALFKQRRRHNSSSSSGQEPAVSTQQAAGAGAGAGDAAAQPQPGRPQRLPQPAGPGRPHGAFGWVFAETDVFDTAALQQLLAVLASHVQRCKGVFRTGTKQWVAHGAGLQPAAADGGGIGGAQGTSLLQPLCYRGCSMVEVIMEASRPFELCGQLAQLQQSGTGAAAPACDAAQPDSFQQACDTLERALIGCLRPAVVTQ